MNSRVTKKERGLIKGALRRVFSRSELRKEAIEKSRIEVVDSSRPRVKKWSMCPSCDTLTPTYLMEVDHRLPVVPMDKSVHDMGADELVDRIWCEPINLQALCKACHKRKSMIESKERRRIKKEKKNAKL